ncbi:hypothetical protein DPM13_09630 [Paracoccus mutanolyticus]|uniref:Uncharacterized protein n=1 Tax=Paracoccus mutanolyticus TaxID=1499308 RepID=A0ABM6WRN5_9RHOB|nr:hypothetical protein DPM13_09630 [Paracoccus mutanolyticus]
MARGTIMASPISAARCRAKADFAGSRQAREAERHLPVAAAQPPGQRREVDIGRARAASKSPRGLRPRRPPFDQPARGTERCSSAGMPPLASAALRSA